MANLTALEHLCPHGYDKRYVTCNRCADPAFDAAKQPAATLHTVSFGGTPLASKNRVADLMRIVRMGQYTIGFSLSHESAMALVQEIDRLRIGIQRLQGTCCSGDEKCHGCRALLALLDGQSSPETKAERPCPRRPDGYHDFRHEVCDCGASRGDTLSECSGDPANCPENEGRGCCEPNPVAWRRLINSPYEKHPRYGYSEEAFEGGEPLYARPAPKSNTDPFGDLPVETT